MEEPLIKIKTPFQAEYDKCKLKLDELRQCNDKMTQRTSNIQPDEIKTLKNKFKPMCEAIKDILTYLEKQGRGVEQRRLVREIKQVYTKEVDRQTRLLKSMVNTSFQLKLSTLSMLKQSRAVKGDEKEQNQYFLDPQNIVVETRNAGSQLQNSLNSYSIEQLQGQLLSEQDIQEMEKQILNEKQEELDEIEEEAIMLNKIAGEVNEHVYQQEESLEQIQDNQQITKANLIGANNELISAKGLQQNKHKMLLIIAASVLLVAVILIIIVVIALKNKN